MKSDAAVSLQAFHGNIVAVYTKSHNAPQGAESLKNSSCWTRHVIDDYGPLDVQSQTGTLHHVASVPFARDTVHADSFAVACMGARKHKHLRFTSS